MIKPIPTRQIAAPARGSIELDAHSRAGERA